MRQTLNLSAWADQCKRLKMVLNSFKKFTTWKMVEMVQMIANGVKQLERVENGFKWWKTVEIVENG